MPAESDEKGNNDRQELPVHDHSESHERSQEMYLKCTLMTATSLQVLDNKLDADRVMLCVSQGQTACMKVSLPSDQDAVCTLHTYTMDRKLNINKYTIAV